MRDEVRISAALSVIRGVAISNGFRSRPIRSRLDRLQSNLFQDTEENLMQFNYHLSDEERIIGSEAMHTWAEEVKWTAGDKHLGNLYMFCDQLLAKVEAQGIELEYMINPNISEGIRKILEHLEHGGFSIDEAGNEIDYVASWLKYFSEDIQPGDRIKVSFIGEGASVAAIGPFVKWDEGYVVVGNTSSGNAPMRFALSTVSTISLQPEEETD